ncbi:MAG: alcohol dehydrogenase, partial [Gammaproteobacteria bacterium]|nr:alcohol dehydrogenase [Gammaproteobacteria bacterium]
MARLLGAHHYIDSAATDAAKALTSIGGARVILATAPDAGSMSALFDGLGPNGTLL